MELLVRDGTFVWVSSTFFPKLWAKVRGSGYFMNKGISAKAVP